MRRAALLLLLGNAGALSPEGTARTYGGDVLKLYAQTKPGSAAGKMTALECARLKAPPAAVKECTLYVWGAQVTAEIVYETPGKPGNNWRRIRLGQMSGLPSSAQAKALTQALAAEANAWVRSPAGQKWFAEQNKKQSVAMYGYRLDCATFSKKRLPAGVKACFEGPGPADGPELTLLLADGRTFSAGLR